MTRKIKTTLLTAFFFFGLLAGLQAQEKYEYAVVSVSSYGVCVIKHTIEYIQTPKGSEYNTVVINKVEEMTNEGWEVFNTAAVVPTNSANVYHTFYLRKKKN